jgi:hypothetical protein
MLRESLVTCMSKRQYDWTLLSVITDPTPGESMRLVTLQKIGPGAAVHGDLSCGCCTCMLWAEALGSVYLNVTCAA